MDDHYTSFSMQAYRPKIIDATLREGIQTPGVMLNHRQSLEILEKTQLLGVDMIEVGHPVASQEQFDLVKACVASSRLPCLAHARATQEDIWAVHASGAAWVGIFAGVNVISQKDRLNRTLGQILELISRTVCYAKGLGLKIRYTVEDASNTEELDLFAAYDAAIRAGADRICYADTIGVLEPEEVTKIIRCLKEKYAHVELEVHFHDDRGLAMANTLSAVDAGADWISSTINGIGERCGITDTLNLISNLDFRGTRLFSNELKYLPEVSRIVAAHSRTFVDARRPVVGKNAFTHTAKLHVNAVRKNPSTYCWRDPRDFGLSNKIASAKLPESLLKLINIPPIISATELRHHRKGPGSRYVMLDERFIEDCRQYCIVRDIEVDPNESVSPHVDIHRHACDSLFLFLGKKAHLTGLTVAVKIDDEEQVLHSPAAVFIPAGRAHMYRIIHGSGLYINHVLSGTYDESLLE